MVRQTINCPQFSVLYVEIGLEIFNIQNYFAYFKSPLFTRAITGYFTLLSTSEVTYFSQTGVALILKQKYCILKYIIS